MKKTKHWLQFTANKPIMVITTIIIIVTIIISNRDGMRDEQIEIDDWSSEDCVPSHHPGQLIE
jgi:hypothetical protein